MTTDCAPPKVRAERDVTIHHTNATSHLLFGGGETKEESGACVPDGRNDRAMETGAKQDPNLSSSTMDANSAATTVGCCGWFPVGGAARRHREWRTSNASSRETPSSHSSTSLGLERNELDSDHLRATSTETLGTGTFLSDGDGFIQIEQANRASEKVSLEQTLLGRISPDVFGAIGQGMTVDGKVLESHEDFFSNPDNVNLLKNGGALFCFTCPKELTRYEHDMVSSIANLSMFPNEEEDNCVPHIDTATAEGIRNFYTAVLTKCVYFLPGTIEGLGNPSRLASYDYQRNCQPDGTFVWDDCITRQMPNTFRITKPAIPYLYWITVQFRASRLPESALRELSSLIGVRVDCGLLLERTKRNKRKQDRTRKAKSVLLYTQVDGGVLVHHLTVILQSSLPKIIERMIGRFGTWGLGEACETVEKARRYTFLQDQRKEQAPAMAKS